MASSISKAAPKGSGNACETDFAWKPQTTLRHAIGASGVGLHTGVRSTIRLKPAAADTGVVFVRTDTSDPVTIPATLPHVVDTRFATSVGREGVQVSTIEHLMSALSGIGVDNVIVEIDSAEVPIMDGSAAPYVFLLQSAGIAELDVPRKYLRVRQSLEYCEAGAKVTLQPDDAPRFQYTLNYDHPYFAPTPERQVEYVIDDSTFVSEISRARTFGFAQEMTEMRKHNLALGGSLKNAILVDEDHLVNEEGLRLEEEFAVHKLLDAIGDLYLLGCPLLGRFSGYKSGHTLNRSVLELMLRDPSNYDYVYRCSETGAVQPMTDAC